MPMLTTELLELPGVVAAGEYSYRGDRFSCRGAIDDEMARMASIMCRATSMSGHMQMGMLDRLCAGCGGAPVRGWVVRGPRFTVCNVANVFAFLDNAGADLDAVLSLMQERLADAPAAELV